MSVHSVKCQSVSTCLWLRMSHLISGESVIRTVKSMELTIGWEWRNNKSTESFGGKISTEGSKIAGKLICDY
jgi:hypothetical protein